MKEEIINEFDIEFAIQKIAPKIMETLKEYNKKPTNELKEELKQLILDREAIYLNDKEVIRKYI